MSTTAFRGAGRPEAAVAIERMVDRFAAEIGMDPAEVRRRNFVAPLHRAVHDGDRHASTTSATTRRRSSGRCRRPATTSCAPSRPRRRADGDPIALGIGIATYVEITAGVPGAEFGVGRGARGRRACSCAAGPTPNGQGHDTTWAMIVADATGVPIEQIEVVHGDTDLVPPAA